MSSVFKAIGGIFSSKMPKVKVPSMPDPESPAVKLAARRKVESRRKEGREGTIYTRSGGAYTGSNLAGTQ